MSLWQQLLTAISTALFLLAIFFSFKLSRETKGEKYWFFLVIAALSMAVFHAVRHPWLSGFLDAETVDAIMEIAEIVGAFSLAYACFGLYSLMKRIREKISEEL